MKALKCKKIISDYLPFWTVGKIYKPDINGCIINDVGYIYSSCNTIDNFMEFIKNQVKFEIVDIPDTTLLTYTLF